jgi:hypothetical protein
MRSVFWKRYKRPHIYTMLRRKESVMGRLTIKDEQGNWALKGVKWNQLHVGETITQQVQEKIYGALAKLKDYEDSGMTPDECWDCCNREKVATQLEKLKSLVPVNRVLDDIVNDKPKELGMLIAYEKAIEIVKGGGVDA